MQARLGKSLPPALTDFCTYPTTHASEQPSDSEKASEHQNRLSLFGFGISLPPLLWFGTYHLWRQQQDLTTSSLTTTYSESYFRSSKRSWVGEVSNTLVSPDLLLPPAATGTRSPIESKKEDEKKCWVTSSRSDLSLRHRLLQTHCFKICTTFNLAQSRSGNSLNQ